MKINLITFVVRFRRTLNVKRGKNVFPFFKNILSTIGNGDDLTEWSDCFSGKKLYFAPNAAGGPFNGLIDDVRIYNYARTQEQIRLDYNAGLSVHFK